MKPLGGPAPWFSEQGSKFTTQAGFALSGKSLTLSTVTY